MIKKYPFHVLFALAAGILATVPLGLSFFSKDGNIPGMGLEGAVFSGFWAMILFLVLRRLRPFIAPYPSMIIGALMVAKPKLTPVTHLWKGVRDPFPLFSETHLYFIIPGVTLVTICFLSLLKNDRNE